MTLEIGEQFARLRDGSAVGDVIRALGVAVYMTDAEGRITVFNDAAADLWGRRPELGVDLWCGSWRLFHPDGTHMDHDACPMARTLKEGVAVRGEAIAERPDGTRIWFQAFPTPFLDASGAVEGAVNVLIDITERKRNEIVSFEQQRLLELIASGTPLDRCLTELCSAARRLNPHARASILLASDDRSKVWRSIAPDLPQSFRTAFDHQLMGDPSMGAAGEAARSGQRIVSGDIANEDGWSPAWRDLCLASGVLACHATPVPGTDGPVAVFMLCFNAPCEPDDWEQRIADFGAHIASIAIERDRSSRDLHESRSRMGAELVGMRRLQTISTQMIREEESASLYEHILDAAISIMRSDFASMQLFYPDRGEHGELRLLASRGFDEEAKKFWEWVTPSTGSSCGTALRTRERCILPDIPNDDAIAGTAEQEWFFKAGVHAAQTTPLVSRSGELVGMISTHWGKPHEPSEAELRLFDVLARQAADLIERGNAESALREALAVKDEFLGMVSHELRTPITTVLGNADVLIRRGDGLDLETRSAALRDVLENARRLNRIIGDLLTVARAERGALDAEPISFGRIVAATVEECRLELEQPIELNGHAESVLAEGHEGVVSQVVRNYLSNAEKYGRGAATEVVVERAGGEALVRVLDRGPGIRAEEAGRLFDPFYRSKNAGPVGGMGLGLAVCKRLAEAVGGRVWVAPREGGGAEFGLALPLCDDGADGNE